MDAWTLIAHFNDDVRDEIERAVLDVAQPWLGKIVHAQHAEGVRAQLFANGEAECRIIVIAVALPKDAASPLSGSAGNLGVEVVRELRGKEKQRSASGPFVPVVFISEHADAPLYKEMQDLGSSRFVRLGTDWSANLALQVSDLPRGSGAMRYRRGLNLDLRLLKQWSWQLDGEGVEDGGEIHRNDSILEDILELSGAIAKDRAGHTWTTLLNSIRKQLNELFFRATLNEKLNRGLLLSIGRVGASNARVRFTVDDGTHDLFLEALQDPENSSKFWMLKAPIYRRYDRPGRNFPLFKDRASRHGGINCLVIAANPAECEALGAPWHTPLEELPQLEAEVEEIRKTLVRAEADGCVGRTVVFRAKDDHPAEAKSALEELLRDGPWHLVHFVGHAVRQGSNGALVLDGARSVLLSTDWLASQLTAARNQFLYLSSCKSADAYFVMRLVDQSLPAVLGYRWPVRDDKAFAFARYFYRALFEEEGSRKYLEYALLNAKRRLYGDTPENAWDSTWAAPVLVMQVDRAQDDLGLQSHPAAARESRPAWH